MKFLKGHSRRKLSVADHSCAFSSGVHIQHPGCQPASINIPNVSRRYETSSILHNYSSISLCSSDVRHLPFYIHSYCREPNAITSSTAPQ
uniref:Uncharacterized protein n=1 Tax=Hyaloperonospora arabidopsidis (strain Emoy2) TaxID=559515 RepID=M4B482_HYAAE